MQLSSRTTSGKIKIGLALDPDVHRLLIEMCGGPREQGRFVSELVRAEARRRQEGDPIDRLAALEKQLTALLQVHGA